MSRSNIRLWLPYSILVFFFLLFTIENDRLFTNAFMAVSKSINTPSHLVGRTIGRENSNAISFYNLFRNEKIKSSSSSSLIVCWMAKGDGKKSRKKQQPQSQPQQPKEVVITPQRVTNDINIPVRRQIRWAQMKKEAMRNSGTSFRQTNVKRTAYRKSLGMLSHTKF